MSDLDGGVAAPAESTPAPAPEPVQPPNPVSTEPSTDPKPVEAKAEPKKEAPSVRESLQKAAEKVESAKPAEKPAEKTGKPAAETKPVEKAEKPEKVEEPKPAEKPEPQPRDDTGKFTPKEGSEPAKPAFEAPSRFSQDAKAEWAKAHPSVQAEVHRAIKEMESGIEKHRADIEPIRPYIDLAKQNGTTVKEALDRYVGFERELKGPNRIAAINHVFEIAGVSPRDYAAHIMGQTPDQNASQQDAVIRDLKQQISTLQQSVGKVNQTFEQQRTDQVLSTVASFAKDHPRFDELASDIGFFIESGRTSDLAEAYTLAERLNPSPASSAPAATAASSPDLSAQTRKGEKSITGAPGPGSNPASARAPSATVKDSLLRAFAKAG